MRRRGEEFSVSSVQFSVGRSKIKHERCAFLTDNCLSDTRQSEVGALDMADVAFGLIAAEFEAAHFGDAFLKGIEFIR